VDLILNPFITLILNVQIKILILCNVPKKSMNNVNMIKMLLFHVVCKILMYQSSHKKVLFVLLNTVLK